MPLVRALPTWLAWNNANFSSPSGMADPVTGQPEYGGALNAGDYFDATNEEAGNASYTTNGILYQGRYRYVLVDSSATAANVKTGTVGFIRAGSIVKSAVITGAGTGQTNGTYNIAGVGGGGTGAILTVVVAGGLVTSVSVSAGGFGYVAVPTFTVAAGGTPGTVVAQLGTSPNVVTSFDQAVLYTSLVKPVVFLNAITPGNYGFVQEQGTATVLANAAVTSATANAWVDAKSGGAGTVDTRASSNGPIGSTIGQAIDLPVVSNLFKCYLTIAAQQD